MHGLFRSPVARTTLAISAFAGLLGLCPTVWGQLQVTEVMVDSLSPYDSVWEWIEVRNAGSSPVDLDGAFAGRIGDVETATAAVDGTLATNTVIPAGGVAVLYDAYYGPSDPLNFDDQQFRDAWQLGSGVPLVGVRKFPVLTNSGTAFGFWADQTAYVSDVADLGEGPEVVSLDHALFGLDFTSDSGFPTCDPGFSMRWTGSGSYQDGVNWAQSTRGDPGGTTSIEVSITGSANDTDDIGNPGVVPAGGTPAAGLLITEIMYNPASPEDDWEWVEVYNNTGAAIDFSQTNYVLDDGAGTALGGPNLIDGIVPDDSVAVIYNGTDLSLQDMVDAWDPNGAQGTNFIAVTESNWIGALNNSGGDTVALWDDYDNGYLGEPVTGTGRTTENAVSAVVYGVGGDWPSTNNMASIYLGDLSTDPQVGTNWVRSDGEDGISFNAAALAGTEIIHAGGDVGSPGHLRQLDAHRRLRCRRRRRRRRLSAVAAGLPDNLHHGRPGELAERVRQHHRRPDGRPRPRAFVLGAWFHGAIGFGRRAVW